MEQTAEIKNLAMALSKAQLRFTNILKDQKAKILTKSGASYSYSYADLASLIDMVRIPLSENGLAIVQSSDTETIPGVDKDGKQCLVWRLIIKTMLLHNTGEYIKSQLILPVVDTGNNAIQAIGSSITYGRRYELSSMLGIASEVDDDANAATPSKSTVQNAYTPPPPAPDPQQPTLTGMIDKVAKEKFHTKDDYTLWKVDNDVPEVFTGLSDLDLAKILTKLRAYKQKEA